MDITVIKIRSSLALKKKKKKNGVGGRGTGRTVFTVNTVGLSKGIFSAVGGCLVYLSFI